MIFIENNNLDPALNHAIELYVMDKYDEDIFMLWRNRPCILIGRYQNINMEVNLEFTKANGLDVVRRLSGGGAIYCDTDNMQYTFITKQTSISNSFMKFAEPVVKALQSLGLDAEFTGRNDILINRLKVSGNAQFHRNGKIVHHGTLLFKANTYNLSHALKVRDIKFKDKAVQSVASRIGFISNFIKMNVEEFKSYIEEFIKKDYGISKTTVLSDEELKEINKIKDEIFALDEWNYGKGSLKGRKKAEKYSCGIVEITLDIQNNKIKEIYIEGDFFSELGVASLCKQLEGTECSLEALTKAINTIELEKYIKGMEKQTFIKDIMKLIEANNNGKEGIC
ncbi:MAG: lipoate--protein ligase [Treponema sp.]